MHIPVSYLVDFVLKKIVSCSRTLLSVTSPPRETKIANSQKYRPPSLLGNHKRRLLLVDHHRGVGCATCMTPVDDEP